MNKPQNPLNNNDTESNFISSVHMCRKIGNIGFTTFSLSVKRELTDQDTSVHKGERRLSYTTLDKLLMIQKINTI